MKKLLLFTERWSSGGIEILLTEIVDGIDNKEFDVNIVAVQKEADTFDKRLKENDVKVVELNNKVEKLPLIRNLKSFSKLLKLLNKEQPDIIHINIHNSISCIYGFIAKKCSVKKIILHAHNNGFDNDFLKLKTILNCISRKIFYSKSFKYIACSKEAAEFCFNKKALKKCEIINNGIDVSKFTYNEKTRKDYRNKLKLENDFVVGNIGRLVEQKNQIRLLNIFEKIKEIKKNSKLLIIGKGELEESILSIAEKKKLKKDVIILKDRNDVNKILQAMDCFVFPSLYEGYGIVAIEAQAAGLPTFISKNLPKQIFATKNAYKIDLCNKDEEIAKYIIKNTSEKRKNVNMEKYDFKNMLKEIIKKYEEN